MTREIEVFARKTSHARFTVALGQHNWGFETAIKDKLRSSTDILWEDDDDGINVVIIEGNEFYKPKYRISLKD